MKQFLNKRWGPEGLPISDSSTTLSSPPPTSPGIKKSATSRWKKTTKKAVEQKPELNIAAALPSSDDFRTSLLMPNLSARFSMLREQDDPNSLLGKASDDSVLQPRRRSRMLDFGFGSNGLNDIAEVQSINSSIRPPFASRRQDSYASQDGYGSDEDHNGSVLSRARPGEGNTMFGGRQKVYKIAAGGANSSGNLGKAVYEDDIGMSAFQRFKQRERDAREARGSEESHEFDFGLDQRDEAEHDPGHAATPNDSAKDLSHSPSLSSYDKKRSTVSSTGRSEARSSTAATSVASQPIASAPSPPVAPVQQPQASVAPMLKRSDTKTRRLYEQGLDQHMYEQQTSALTRLNSIQRQRTLNSGRPSAPILHGTKSANNIHDRNPQPVYALRTQSPPPLAPLATFTTFGSMRKPNSSTGSPMTSGPQSPVSPSGFDFDDVNVLNQALEPADRGKATAMGAFNKPARQFDENQYLERQKQLQRSQSNAGSKKEPSLFQQRAGLAQLEDRQRSASNASTRSRSRSAPRKHEPARGYNVFQSAASQIQAMPGAQQFDKSTLPDTHRTFFGNISASDSEEEEDEEARDQFHTQDDFTYDSHRGWQPTPLPPVSEHPALRAKASKASLAEEDEYLEPKPLRPTPSSRSLRTDAIDAEKAPTEDVDSPTLGPSSTEQLSSMVHHLRQKSNQSSIYPNDEHVPNDEVPELPDMPWSAKNTDHSRRLPSAALDSESRVTSTHTNSNPWDLDDIDSSPYFAQDSTDRSSISPVPNAVPRGQFGARAPSRTNVQRDRQSEVSQDSDNTNGSQWQQELKKQHNRDASTATQQERDAFASELAARRTAIQENMKFKFERDDQSRGASPVPSISGAKKALGMLRSKSSRESVDVSRREPSAPTKALKMLGIGSSASSTTLNSQFERSTTSFDVTRPRDNSGSRPPPLPTSQPRATQAADWEPVRARGDSETSRPERQPPKGRSPASSDVSGARSRSNSQATTGRSRSRTGPYRDDLEKAMVEGTGSSAAGHPELSPMIPRELTPRPSPETTQSQFDSQTRARSNSRNGMTSYFDAKNLQPIQTGRLAPNGSGPAILSPNVYSPALSSARGSPIVSPYLQNPTPPMSGANTPQTSTFSTPPVPVVQPRQGVLRKKTVSKAEISEPRLVSSTSNIDTVELPEGASLRNGMESPPPLPPINPRRRGTRKWGLGRAEASEDATNFGRSKTLDLNFGRSKTPDPWMSRAPESDFPFELARTTRNHTDGRLNMVPKQSFENHSTPALEQYGVGPASTSPERARRSPASARPVPVEGGMF